MSINYSNAAPPRMTLAEAHTVFRRWLGDDYDTDALDAVLAAAAVEHLDGDPLWLLLISGSGNAKTETVQALDGIGVALSSKDGYSIVERIIPGGATDTFGYSGCSEVMAVAALPCPDISTTGTSASGKATLSGMNAP